MAPLGQGQLPKRVQQRYVPAPAQPGIFLQQRLGAAEARLGRAVLPPIQVGQASFHQGMAARLWPGIEPLRHLVPLQVEAERFVEVEQLKMDAANEVGDPGDAECLSPALDA